MRRFVGRVLATDLQLLVGVVLSALLLGYCGGQEVEPTSIPPRGGREGVVEFSPEEAHSARPESMESKLRPRMKIWASEFRQAAYPIVLMFLEFESEEGLGEEQCRLLYELQSNFGELASPPDAALAQLVVPFHASLDEPVRLCRIWDPGPLASELLFVEQGITVIDLNLATFYGYQALPELASSVHATSGRIEPVDLGDGEIRVRYVRNR